MDDDVPKHFYRRLAGASALIGVVAFVVIIIFWKALVAWGFLGVLLLIAVVSLGLAWYNDRKYPRVD